MKKLIVTLATVIVAFSLTAQELPTPSPSGKVEQKVGLTEVKIEYSRPSVKERKIFGELVKFDELWRLGANACTKLETSTKMVIGGKKIAKGSYSLFAIPSKGEIWTVVINSDNTLRGTDGYDEKKDIVRMKVKVTKIDFMETLTFNIDNLTTNSAVISMSWEKLKIEIPFTVNTKEIAQGNIDKAIKEGKDLDKVYSKAASYYSDMEDYKTALSFVEKSLTIKEAHTAMFTKAKILKAQGNKSEAIESAKAALELANKAESKGWINYIEENIKKWEKE
jgi:tetratricopeptide (TPR) repeat protein